MSVTRRVRFEILRRDNYACRYCGGTAPDVQLTVDHVVPMALGGSDHPSNLVTACADCNSGKSSTVPDGVIVDDVAAEALRWSQAMQHAAEIRRAELADRQQEVAQFDSAWCAYSEIPPGYTAESLPADLRRPAPRKSGWQDEVMRFLTASVDLDYLVYAVETAMNKPDLAVVNVWRYFCGMCWRELDRRRELALELLAGTAPAGAATVAAQERQTTLGAAIDQLLDEGWSVRVLPACIQEWVDRAAPPEDFAQIANAVVNHDVAGRWFGGEIIPPPRTSMPEPQAFGDVISELFRTGELEPSP